MKEREGERQGMWKAENESCKVGRTESEYWFHDSRSSLSECRVSRSPARKNKSQGWSDGCGTPGSGSFAIWMAEAVYQSHARQIKFTFGLLPQASLGTDAPKTALYHNSLNGFDLWFPGLLCKEDVQNVKIILQSQWNYIMCSQMDVQVTSPSISGDDSILIQLA